MVSSIAAQTLVASSSLDSFHEQLTLRLGALSRVQGLLSRSDQQPITIGALLRLEIEALGREAAHKVSMSGPEVQLRKSVVQTLALAVHELATNARKYGAFSGEDGRLSVTWGVEDSGSLLKVQWLEEGLAVSAVAGAGDAVAEGPPSRRGFGRQLIERALPYELNARTMFDLQPSALRCTIELPL